MADHVRPTTTRARAGIALLALTLLAGLTSCGASSGSDGGKDTDGTTTTEAEGGGGGGGGGTTTEPEGGETTTTAPEVDPDDPQSRADVVAISADDLDDGEDWEEVEAPTTSITQDCHPSYDAATDPGVLAYSRNPMLLQGDEESPDVTIAITTLVYEDEDLAQEAVDALVDPDVIECSRTAIVDAFSGDGSTVATAVEDMSAEAPEPEDWIDDMSTQLIVVTLTPEGAEDSIARQQGISVAYRKGDVVTKVFYQSKGFDLSRAGFGQVTTLVQELLDQT